MTVTARPGPTAGGEPARPPAVGIRTDDVLTIVVSGELDAANGPALDAVVQSALTARRPARHVVMDLAELSFCDTAGARALVRADRLATAHGARCRLTRARPHIAWLLRTAGADGVPATPD